MRFGTRFARDFCGTPECGAPIIWATTQLEAWIAVDFDPHPDGDILLVPRDAGQAPLAKKVLVDEATPPLRMVHANSCTIRSSVVEERMAA